MSWDQSSVQNEIDRALKIEQGGNLQEALLLLETLCSQHPDCGDAWLENALLLDKHDRESDAIPRYLRALECSLSPDQERIALTCLASSYRNVGELEKALGTIEAANRRFPQHAVVESFYALILHDAGRYNEALQTIGLTLVKNARPNVLQGFEEAINMKFRELTDKTGRE